MTRHSMRIPVDYPRCHGHGNFDSVAEDCTRRSQAAAVVNIVRAAKELGPQGIRVNAICLQRS